MLYHRISGRFVYISCVNVSLRQPNPSTNHLETQDQLKHNPNTDKPQNSRFKLQEKHLRGVPYLFVDWATFENGVNNENQIQAPSQIVTGSSDPTSQPPAQEMLATPQQTTSTSTTDVDIEAQPQPDTEKSQQRTHRRRCTSGKHEPCFIVSSIVISVFVLIFGFVVMGLVFHGKGISVG
jgi:hypothetical protein